MNLETQIARLETEVKSLKEQIDRNRDHISDLLTSKNTLEGGIKVMVWLLGFIGISNCAAALYVFFKAATSK